MEVIAERIYMEMVEKLNTIKPDNTIQRAELSYNIVKESINNLDEFMKTYEFSDQEEEIKYFKSIRTSFLKEKLFYTELYDVESQKPRNDAESVEQYFKATLRHNNRYFEKHRSLLNYYFTGKTHLDHQLFTREAKSEVFYSGTTIEKDRSMNQGASYILARLQALELINSHIQHEIQTLTSSSPQTAIPGGLTWTAPKVALTEMLYALHAAGAFNYGQAELKTIVNAFQETFQVNLGNYYSVIQQNIRLRKKTRTPFLGQLIEFAERRMDETDENPRYR